jgi:hypothetical protein
MVAPGPPVKGDRQAEQDSLAALSAVAMRPAASSDPAMTVILMKALANLAALVEAG